MFIKENWQKSQIIIRFIDMSFSVGNEEDGIIL